MNGYNLVKNKEYRNLELFVKLGFKFNIFDINQDIISDFGTISKCMSDVLESNNNSLHKYRVCDFNQINEKGFSPISMAIISDNVDALLYMYTTGAKINIINDKKENLFHLATKFKSINVMDFLLNTLPLKLLSEQNENGFTPVLLAASRNDYRAVNILSELVPKNIILQSNKYGANIIHWLSFNNMKDANTHDLLNYISKYDINKQKFHKNAINMDPFDWLSLNNSKECLNKLK